MTNKPTNTNYIKPMSQIESERSNKSLLGQIGNLNQTTNDLSRFVFGMVDSLSIVRWVGYGLLILALFDVIEMFVPANFMNPNWEFQTFGALVERVAVPLIGFVFIFLAGLNEREKKRNNYSQNSILVDFIVGDYIFYNCTSRNYQYSQNS